MGQSCSCGEEEESGEKYTDLKQEKEDEKDQESDQESRSKKEDEKTQDVYDRCTCEENLCCCAICLYVLIET